ncbi:MAG: hypothetical protein RJA07_2458 [Bacteroidota bacterium]|jgi:hypothetical protein
MKIKILYLLGLIIWLFATCKKDSQPSINPPISTTPEIEFIDAIPTTVKQFNDSIKFTIKFTDGDGNVGDISADSFSLFVIDNRNSTLVERYHIPPVAPLNSSIVVQGQFSVILKNTILLNSANASETTTFSFKLKDRTGNFSNTVQSGTITVVK